MRLSAWQKHSAKSFCGCFHVQASRTRWQKAKVRDLADESKGSGVGDGRVEDNQSEFGGGQSVENGPQMGQPFALQRFDNDLVAGIGRFSALAPLRQRLLWIEIERDHPFAGACGYLGEGRGKCRFSGTAFLREKSDAAHQATFCSAAVAASFRNSSAAERPDWESMPELPCEFGISMSTASVDTDLPRSTLICTLSGSNDRWRPISARISSRRTSSRSGCLQVLRSCASRICRRSRAMGAEPRRNNLKSFMLPSVQTAC